MTGPEHLELGGRRGRPPWLVPLVAVVSAAALLLVVVGAPRLGVLSDRWLLMISGDHLVLYDAMADSVTTVDTSLAGLEEIVWQPS